MRTGFSNFYYLRFERVEQDKPIPPSALMSMDDGNSLSPIMHAETIGQTPSQFSDQRSFWVPVQISPMELAVALASKGASKIITAAQELMTQASAALTPEPPVVTRHAIHKNLGDCEINEVTHAMGNPTDKGSIYIYHDGDVKEVTKNLMTFKGYLINSLTDGVYLGSAMGLGFWSKLENAGQSMAWTFESREAADSLIQETMAHSPGWTSDLVEIVEVITEDPQYATIQECVTAGCDSWEPKL